MGWELYDKWGAKKVSPATVQGSELDYAQITAPSANITTTTEATATSIISGNSITYDGTTKVKIEFWAPEVSGNNTSSSPAILTLVILRDTTVIGQIKKELSGGGWAADPLNAEVFDTPSAGAHVYSVKAFVNTTTGVSHSAVVNAGAGGSGNFTPAFLRVTRADPQVVIKYVGVPGALLGQELDYAQITANTAAISVTTEATSVAVIIGNSVTYDGSKVKIEVFIPLVTSNVEADFVIYRDTTPIGQIAVGNFGNAPGLPLKAEMFDTPSAGSHTYSVKAYVGSAGSVVVKCGSGGSGNRTPAFLRVTRAA